MVFRKVIGLSVFVSLYSTGFGQVPAAPSSPDPNTNMNWIISRGYDAQGTLTGEKKNFFDNLGRPGQSQIKSLSYAHVLATQVIYDEYGRPSLTTLPAPTNNQAFAYKSGFALKDATTEYDYRHFDDASTNTVNNPEPLFDNGAGTLGWYYGNNNTWEKYQATTQYPYTRTDYYKDGTSMEKRTAGVGDYHRMGLNRELMNFTTPVVNELNYYLSVRNQYFPTSAVGEAPTNLKYEAVQMITRDRDGKESVVVQDKSGHILMTARPASGGLLVTNTVTLKGYPHHYEYINASGYRIDNIKLEATGTGKVYANSVLIYTGSLIGYTYSATGIYQFNVESDNFFAINYDGFDPSNNPTGNINSNSISLNEPSVYYFKIMEGSTIVTITGGTYQLIDMKTETNTSLLGSGSATYLSPGYYKAVALQSDVTVSYNNSYTDLSYSFYNQLGQLIASIAPEGVTRLRSNGFTSYPTKDDLPFTSLNTYNIKGQLISTKDADRKQSVFIFRMDGKIRFSQNPNQYATNTFSYINYDQWGRIIESGEFQPAIGNTFTFNSSAMLSALETTASDGGFLGTSGTKKDWLKTVYDFPNTTHGLSGYLQNEFYLRGAVSYTESPAAEPVGSRLPPVNQTWYNYDDQGRIIWVIQHIYNLGYKTIDYTYDISGRLLTTTYQKDISGEMFVHAHTYDSDQRLKRVYTSTTTNFFDPQNPGSNWKLQAEYYYYLTGELKRIELADKLQGIDYTYTVQGWPKAINHSDRTKDPGNDAPANNNTQVDAFGMTLEYFDGDYLKSNSNISSINPSGTQVGTFYGGNIRATTWYSQKPVSAGINDNPNMYAFSYDNKYQFNQSYWYTSSTQTGSYAEQANTYQEMIGVYDANGNIGNLVRKGNPGIGGDYNDNLTYNYFINSSQGAPSNYINNKLHSVTGTGFNATYQYDDRGQLTGEQQAGGLSKYMKYDVMGNVVAVYSDASLSTLVVTFTYNERGQRVMKASYSPGGDVVNTFYVYDIAGNLLANYSTYGSDAPYLTEQPLHAMGKIGVYYRQANDYRYELNDHLGNVRAVIRRNTGLPGQVEILQYCDYYPFGLVLRTAGTPYRYGYQGQYSEKDPETGWNAFDLRMYDSRIARWNSYDPAGQFISPYVAMANDPLGGVDPSGGFWEELKNFVFSKEHLFISNAGLAKYRELAPNHFISYKWEGNRKEGAAILKYTVYDEYKNGYGTEGLSFGATYDHVFNLYVNGEYQGTFEEYLDFEAYIDVGLQWTFSGLGGKIFVNASSMTLWKTSFTENTTWSIFNRADRSQHKEHNMGLGFSIAGASFSASMTSKYSSGYYGPIFESTSKSISADFMGVGIEYVINDVNTHNEIRMGYFKSDGAVFGAGVKNYYILKKSQHFPSTHPWALKFRDVHFQ